MLEQMLFEQIAKQAGRQGCLHQTRMAVDTAAAEVGALHLGHQVLPEVPAAEEGGETTDDEGNEGRAVEEENKQKSMQGLPVQAMESPAGNQQHSKAELEDVLPQPRKSPWTNPDAESGCAETPSSPILIPSRLDLRAASKQAAEEKPKSEARSQASGEEKSKSVAKKRGLEDAERPDDSHQTAPSEVAQIHKETPATE
jgi:hypothetical protein